VVLRVRK